LADGFRIYEEKRDSVVVLRLEGFLDAHTAASFENAIQKKVEEGETCLAVDGSKLNYISSAGLGVFMSFIEELRDKNGDIRIGGLIPKVRQVFEILGFTEILQLFNTVDEAVESFQSER